MGTDMLHSPELAKEVKSKSGTDSQPRSVQTQIVDRSVQRWANIVGSLFSVASFTCLLALSIFTVFFISIEAQNGETGITLILVGMGATLCLGMLLLEYTHARALAEYRDAREKNARYTRAIASGVLTVILFMIHPLMPLAIPRVAVFGISMGGRMSYRLACNSGLHITAVVSVAGNIPAADLQNCAISPRPSLLDIHGELDELVSFNGAEHWARKVGIPLIVQG